MKSADDWPPNFTTIDETKKGPIVGVLGNGKPVYGKVNNTLTFERTNYLILVNTRGGNVVFRAWKVKGTYPTPQSARTTLYNRFGDKNFLVYGTMLGGGNYFPRLVGWRYGTDLALFKGQLQDRLAKQGGYSQNQINSIMLALDAKNGWFRTGTFADAEKIIEQGGIAGIPPKDINLGDFVVADPTGGGPGGGRPPKDKNGPAEQPTLPAPVIKIVTRMPRGYAGRGAAASVRPQMVQRYTRPATADVKAANLDDVFTFRYIPQGIKYSGLGSEWVEIPRAEDVPFVDWARWQLMKISFSFIIADDRTEQGGRIVPDGLESSVDSQIEQLRRMAQRKNPVMLFNFDDMLSFQLRRGVANRTSPNMEFVINDLSITATRRTTDPTDGTPTTPSQIAVAQVEITLTEIPVEVVGIVALPPIQSPFIPPPKKGKKGPVHLEYPLWTPTFSDQPEDASTTIGGQP
jgi:hypothetical protein